MLETDTLCLISYPLLLIIIVFIKCFSHCLIIDDHMLETGTLVKYLVLLKNDISITRLAFKKLGTIA